MPKTRNPRAVVLFAHGNWGNVACLAEMLKVFREGHRVAVMVFDYRGFGGSGGEPGRLIPEEQIEDIRNALCYLESRPDVDPSRLGLYGTSFGGGNVAATAAIEARFTGWAFRGQANR